MVSETGTAPDDRIAALERELERFVRLLHALRTHAPELRWSHRHVAQEVDAALHEKGMR